MRIEKCWQLEYLSFTVVKFTELSASGQNQIGDTRKSATSHQEEIQTFTHHTFHVPAYS